MKTLSENKATSRYNYKGSQIPCRTSVIGSSVTSAKRSASKSASAKPGYTMTTVPNMTTMSAPMIGGAMPATQYQSIGAGPMAMPSEYTVQLPNVQPMYPQIPGLMNQGSSMYPAASPMGGATPQVISPAELSALMKTPGAMIQPQTTNWGQFGSVQPAMSGFNSSIMYPGAATMAGGATPQIMSTAEMAALMKTPGAVMQPQTAFMPSYSGRPSANSFIVSCSDDLKILDGPTGGTTYMPN